MEFDLITQPWLPARSREGTIHRLGLRDVLGRAHELFAVEHPIPIVEAGLLRLLVAIVLDAAQPRSLDHLLDLLDQGRFDGRVLDEYFDQHRAAFDLFSSTRPFLQDATAAGDEKPVAALLPSQPSGTGVMHWQHEHESEFAVHPAEAAALLTSVAPFMTAGGAGLPPSINGAPPWYVMLTARTLFHTLVYNLWVRHHSDIKRGVPAWRRTRPLDTDSRRTSATLLEALTWQPRRIRLVAGSGGLCSLSGEECPVLVRCMHFTAGESCDFPWTDPNVAYAYGNDKRVPIRPQEDRDPWRDVGALALLHDTRQKGQDRVYVRPPIVSQFAELCAESPDLGQEDVGLILYGMRTDLKMKVFEWLQQPLVLPIRFLVNDDLARWLVGAVSEAEDMQKALKKALARAVTLSGYEPSAERDALVRSAARSLWGDLEPRFQSFANRLGSLEPERDAAAIEETLAGWRGTVGRAARHAFHDATAGLRLDAERLAAIEHGRSQLAREILRLTGSSAPAEPIPA